MQGERTALAEASGIGSIGVAKLLLDKGADQQAKNYVCYV